MRTALTIAGSDPGGGAGIQADLKTFAAHEVFGLTAITAVTAQDTGGVTDIWPVPAQLVAAQIDAVILDIGAHATKIGMLATGPIAAAVARAIDRHALPHVVLDTVLHASNGTPLLDDEGVEILRRHILPMAEVVTANVPEAVALTGMSIRTVGDARHAAERLTEIGARAAIVKGGHLDGPAIDVLFDGHAFVEFHAARIRTRHTHGTGCTFASAIAARLALGDSLVDAVRGAKEYVTRAISQAPGLGRARGPLQHFPS